MRRLIAAYRAQIDLWERFFAAQRPWEQEGPLRWVWRLGGWELHGSELPEPRSPRGRVDLER